MIKTKETVAGKRTHKAQPVKLSNPRNRDLSQCRGHNAGQMNIKLSKNNKKRKFKQTRELIILALSDSNDWTQTSIAKACRTHQSIVSDWKSGAKQATEEQLAPLLEIYGYKLRRNSFRSYWAIGEDKRPTYYKVEGKTILSQSFCDPRRAGTRLEKKIPKKKLVVHDQGRGQFRIVFQQRLVFKDTNQELECSQEDAIWGSSISDSMSTPELLASIESYCEKELKQEYLADFYTLPFLIRKALLNHGHSVEDLVEYPASW